MRAQRNEQVSELRRLIEAGSYEVPAESVALAVWRATREAVHAFRSVDG